jgi:hypothetical protein
MMTGAAVDRVVALAELTTSTRPVVRAPSGCRILLLPAARRVRGGGAAAESEGWRWATPPRCCRGPSSRATLLVGPGSRMVTTSEESQQVTW